MTDEEPPAKILKLNNKLNGHVTPPVVNGGDEEDTVQEFSVIHGPNSETDEYELDEDEIDEGDDEEVDEDEDEENHEFDEEEEDNDIVVANAKDIFQVQEFQDILFNLNAVRTSKEGKSKDFNDMDEDEDNEENQNNHVPDRSHSNPDSENHNMEDSGEHNTSGEIIKRGKGRPKGSGKKGKNRKTSPEFEFPKYLLEIFLPENVLEELKCGFNVLKRLMKQKCSFYFLNEPSMTDVSDKIEYDETIAKPMWLNLIDKNFAKCDYTNIRDIICDIRLIIENCYTFWSTRNDNLIKKALKLEQCLEQSLAVLPEHLQEKSSLLSTHGEIEDSEEWEAHLPTEGKLGAAIEQLKSESKLFRIVQMKNYLSQLNLEEDLEKRKQEKESLELDIIDFENTVIFADGVTLINAVNSMWELADIGHFIYLVQKILHIVQPTQLEVERMFAIPQYSKTLANIMTALLVRPSSRYKLDKGPPMPYSMWTQKLSQKVTEWYKIYHAKNRNEIEVFSSIGIDPMFWNILGGEFNPLENFEYHDLHYFQRVWMFKSLCSFVLHNHKSMLDLFNTLPPNDLRVPPIGTDNKDNVYYFYSHFTDVRIYKQNVSKTKSVGNYPMLPISMLISEIETNGYPITSNEQPKSTPGAERELYLPKPTILPLNRPNKLMIVAHSVESLNTLIQKLKSDKEKDSLITELTNIYVSLKEKHSLIEYETNKARAKMLNEYIEIKERPNDYIDPDLNYWNYYSVKVDNGSLDQSEEHDNSNDQNGSPCSDNELEDGENENSVRRSKRESHMRHPFNDNPLSELDDSEDEKVGEDIDTEDEWAPNDNKKKKIKNIPKSTGQNEDEIIKASSDTENDLDEFIVKSPELNTPEPSPMKEETIAPSTTIPQDPLSLACLKKEIAEGKEVKEEEPPKPSKPTLKIKSNIYREDINEGDRMLILPQMTQPPMPLDIPQQMIQPPLIPPMPFDIPQSVLLNSNRNVKKEDDDDDDIEVIEEKVVNRPPSAMFPPPNAIVNIGNMLYKLNSSSLPPGAVLHPGMLPPGVRHFSIRQLPPGVNGIRQSVPARRNGPRSVGDGLQNISIQNPRSLNPTVMRGRPQAPTARAQYMRGQMGSRVLMMTRPRMVRSPMQRNITPRKQTPPPIPRQLLNRNISVSIVEPKPKPVLPKLSGVTITPTKNKPSPVKTLIFNSSPKSSKSLSISSSPSPSSSSSRTQTVDANVQLTFRADGSTSYAIELGNNQTHELSKEQITFFMNKNRGVMPNVVRITVPIEIARRVKPPCITL